MGVSANILPINQLDETNKKWFAIYTKYKCEKYVVEQLKKKGIKSYVPLLKVTKRYTRKVKNYEVPLINCYAFVYINKREYIKVLETQYVHHFLKIRKDLISIPDEEIQLLRRIVGEFQEIEARPDQFQVGKEVEIISGNLTGLRGILISQQGKSTFVVQLEAIGYQLSMNVDVKLLRLIKKSKLA